MDGWISEWGLSVACTEWRWGWGMSGGEMWPFRVHCNKLFQILFSKNNTTQDFRAKWCEFCIKNKFIPSGRDDVRRLLILTIDILHREMHPYQIILLNLIKAKFTYTFYSSREISQCREDKMNLKCEPVQPRGGLSVQWAPHWWCLSSLSKTF